MNFKQAILLGLIAPSISFAANYKLSQNDLIQPDANFRDLDLKDCQLLEIEGTVPLSRTGVKNLIKCETIRFAPNASLVTTRNLIIETDTIEGDVNIIGESRGFMMLGRIGPGMGDMGIGMMTGFGGNRNFGPSREQQRQDAIKRRNEFCKTLNTNGLPQVGEDGIKDDAIIMSPPGNSILLKVNKFVNTNSFLFQSKGGDGQASPFPNFITNGQHGSVRGGNGVDGKDGRDGGQGGNLRIDFAGDYSEIKNINFTIDVPGGKGGDGEFGGLGGCGQTIGKDGADGQNGFDGVEGSAFVSYGDQFSIITNRTVENSKLLAPETLKSVELKEADNDSYKEIVTSTSGNRYVNYAKHGIAFPIRISSLLNEQSDLIVNGNIAIGGAQSKNGVLNINVNNLIFKPNSRIETRTNLKLKSKTASGKVVISGTVPSLQSNGPAMRTVFPGAVFKAQNGGNGGNGGNGHDASQKVCGLKICRRHAAGGGAGGNGGHGQPGVPGANGVKGLDGRVGRHILFELDTLGSLTSLAIESHGQQGLKGSPGLNGQDGGDGGNGGHGGKGGKGKYGMSSKHGGRGGNAGNGGQGGKGGNGGAGGNGGDAGQIQFVYNGEKSDLQGIELNLSSLGGDAGKGGLGGRGGKGGRPGTRGNGGQGGDGNYWGTTSGGSNGLAGAPGSAGSPGRDGDNGEDGVAGNNGVPKKPLILQSISEADEDIFMNATF